ncbi:MAG: hypothetical protein GY913_18890 [Proteobacteria bacterium]|nr:hypothetical protein [Pseudomonadota bacterium]MCP4918978.1 hypothetical protein [Pseudomonadota bacterium]
MFSDRSRLPIALVCLAWLMTMAVLYTDVVTSRVGWIQDCSADKAACDGRRVFLALSEVVAIEGDSYTVRKVTEEHRVDGDATGLELGETISVIARFDAATDTISEESRESHPWREEKVLLGYLGLLLALGVAGFGVRFRDGRLVSRG